MAEKAPLSNSNHDVDSGVVSAQLPISPNDSPTQQESPPIQKPSSQQPVQANGQLSLDNGVLVFKEPERPNDIDMDSNEETAGVPMLETQGPLPPSNQSGARFTIGPLFPQEESGGSEQSASMLLLQEAQKLMGKETREQKAKLSGTEAKLKQTEIQLQDTKEKLAKAEAKTVEVERKLGEMTKKKDEAERKLAEIEAKREEELQQYNKELSSYKKRLALMEKKNEAQRTEYKKKIEELTAEMEQKKQSYDKDVLELTKETCDLKLQVANMKTEEQSLKRQIAELQRDIEHQAKVNISEKFADYKSSSENEIKELRRLLSEASINSNSPQELEEYSFKFSEN